MSWGVLLAVLGAALLHAGWNAMAKGGAKGGAKGAGGDALARSARIALGSAVTALPALALTGLPAPGSAPFVAASALIHVAYFILIGLAYRGGDYSAVYPLVRGGAPLLTALIASLWLDEALGPLAWAGIGLLCCGVVGLGVDAIRRGGLDRRGLATAALTAGVVVAYTLTDGLGARASGNAAAYVLAMMALTGLLLLPLALVPGGAAWREASRAAWIAGLVGGAMATLSYGTALWAMTKAPIGLVGAVRETSVLFAALIAVLVLRERFGAARWAAAAAIVAGLGLAQAGAAGP